MLKILIVEDEFEKKRLLVETLIAVEGVNYDNIDYATDVRSAKKSIRAKRYDLVILDINIPPTPEHLAEVGAGLAILNFIKVNLNAKAPAFVVGMTAYDDAASAAEIEFSSPLWKLVRFSHTDMSWQSPLRQAAEYLVSQNTPPYINDGHSFHTDLAIFVALEDEELDSIRALPGNWVERKVPHDHSRYFEGSFHAEDGSRISVVTVAAPKMGLPAAAVTAAKLISTYRPRYIAVSGICAGVRTKVNIGDILIADPCFDWGSGKWVRDADGSVKFKPAPYPWRLNERIRSKIRSVSEDGDFLYNLHKKYPGNKPTNIPQVYIDAMASGGSVLQVGKLVDDVRDQHKNLIGIEMESYAVFTAAEYSADPKPQCFAIKAVCDFGDEKKDDAAHKFAAYASAEFLKRVAVEIISEEL